MVSAWLRCTLWDQERFPFKVLVILEYSLKTWEKNLRVRNFRLEVLWIKLKNEEWRAR